MRGQVFVTQETIVGLEIRIDGARDLAGVERISTAAGGFLQQVREEGNKVAWPSRREITISTVMVFIMVVVASIFFLIVDGVLNWGVKALFGI